MYRDALMHRDACFNTCIDTAKEELMNQCIDVSLCINQ